MSKADLSKFVNMAKNLDVQAMVKHVKGMVNPDGATPAPEDGDALGLKMQELSILLQESAAEVDELKARMLEANQLLNDIFAAVAEKMPEQAAAPEASAESVAEREGVTEKTDAAE